MTELLKNNKGLKILTDTGFSHFDGLLIKNISKILNIKTETSEINCTFDHRIFLGNLEYKFAKDLTINDTLALNGRVEKIISITEKNPEQTYDVFNVHHNHRFYANDILVKNCEFLVFDETLISSVCLAEMQGIEPKEKLGQVRWYNKIKPSGTYLVALDPSTGTGGDYSAIEIFELPSFEQIGEWHHNTTQVKEQIRLLKDITTYIQAQGDPQIYYSVENNTIGEACLVSIKDVGEDNIPGLFLSEPIRKGHVRKFRKGFNTTHKTKMTAAVKLKSLIESRKMKIYSKPLISELKTFVATGMGFKAKVGEHDDLVSSCLLICRMAAVLGDWDPEIYDSVSDRLEDENLPMPIFISSFM